jgi:hypothetical protein
MNQQNHFVVARRLITAAAIATMQAAGVVSFGVFVAWLLMNWALGCGESFPTAGGTYVTGECIQLTELATLGYFAVN